MWFCWFITEYSTFPKFPDFIMTDVPSDGNCQFAAIALQLGRDASDSWEIRQEIVKHLRTHGVSYYFLYFLYYKIIQQLG